MKKANVWLINVSVWIRVIALAIAALLEGFS